MWNNLFDFSTYANGFGNSGFGLAQKSGLDLRPTIPDSSPTLLGVDLTHRIDVSEIAGGAAAKGGPGGGGGGGGGGTTSSFDPYVAGAVGGYNIKIEFKGSWTQEYVDIFKGAANFLTGFIAQDIPDVYVRAKGALTLVDDILITAELGNIDGAGGVLGQAGPTSIRTASYLPATASMKFDIADADVFKGQGLFDDIVVHEMSHSLGFGSIWGYKNLVAGGLYKGAEALAQYQATAAGAGATGIPVEQDGGSGTAGSHWDEETFVNELMTGYIDADNYVSPMTVAAFRDLGYGLAGTNYAQYADAGNLLLG